MAQWLAHFPLHRKLHVVDGDNFVLRPWEEAERLQDFLRLPRELTRGSFVASSRGGRREGGYYCWKVGGNGTATTRCMGETKGNRHDMEAGTERKLRDFFRPHNEKLFGMLGRTFEWR